MATVFVVTAGSGDSYRIERVYLDSEQAYGFAQDYNGIAPVDPVQVEEWQAGGPLLPTTVRTGAREWARIPASKRRGGLRHTDEGDRFDDFGDSGEEWWTGGGAAGGHGGAPGTDRGAQDRGGGFVEGEVEEIFWDAVTQARAELAGCRRK